MNWINNVVRPKINSILRKREMPDNLWVKCPDTGQMVFHKDLEANDFVVPGSNYHMRMSAPARLASLFDDGSYDVIEVPEVAADPLKFRDERRYSERLKSARDQTGLADAVLVGEGRLDRLAIVAAVQDFKFMGGSLGMAAGEAVITGMQRALETKSPFIMFAASGGARMQEGMLSLMQMPRTTVAVQQLREAGLPYIVVLTHPTTGGVTASYAMLGDIHIAEPGALIGFAGPRVIEQTIREQLPEGFQRAEYLRDHGVVDMVVHRHEMRATLSRICRMLVGAEAAGVEVASEADSDVAIVDEVEQEAPAKLNGAATAELVVADDDNTPGDEKIEAKAPAPVDEPGEAGEGEAAKETLAEESPTPPVEPDEDGEKTDKHAN